MRISRVAYVATICLAWLTSASAQAPVNAHPQPGRGPLWYDVEAYGGRPGAVPAGVPTPTDIALELIYQDIKAAGRPGATIHFRDDPEPWYLSRPFFAPGPGVTIRGQGRDKTTVAGVNGYHGPLLMLGYPRTAGPRFGARAGRLSADHWIDAAGKLDAAAGRRWGLRTGQDAHVALWASPFSSGWQDRSKLTIDLAIDGTGPGGKSPVGTYLGMGSTADGPTPFDWDCTEPNRFRVEYRAEGEPRREYQFSSGDATGVQRLAFQIDLARDTFQAFVNGRQVAVTRWNGSPPPAPDPARRFVDAGHRPFLLGAYSAEAWTRGEAGPNHGGGGPDLAVLGLMVAEACRYADDGPGTACRRLGGEPYPGDVFTYFRPFFPGAIACLTLNDGPDGYADGRLVSWQIGGGWNTGCGLFVTSEIVSSGPGGWTAGLAVRDMTVRLADPRGFGQAIAVGSVLDLEMSNVEARGGSEGVGAWNCNANYRQRYANCRFAGREAGFASYSADVLLGDCQWFAPSMYAIRLVGTSSSVRNARIWDGAGTVYPVLIREGSTYGGQHVIDGLSHDGEGGRISAGIYAELHKYSQTRLDLRNLTFASILPGKPAIDLRSAGTPAQGYWPAECVVDGLNIQSPGAVNVKAQAGWTTRVSGVMTPEMRAPTAAGVR